METSHSRRAADKNKEDIYELFAKHVSSGKAQFFKSAGIDFALGKREGVYIWDIEGEKQLIDCHCNGGVFNLGHRNPEIVQILTQSLQEFDIGNHHLISEPRATLAARLAGLAPGDLPYTVFGVGGGEAIDLAIKIARGYTGKRKVISARGGYHGHTGLAIEAGDEKYRLPFGLAAPEFLQVSFGDIEALKGAVDDTTAAVLFETIPATAGILIPPDEFFRAVRELCDHLGILLLIDEVQAGLGRTGRLWGIENFDVEPDIMVIGKGLSGGIYPITATCFKAKFEAVFHRDPFVHVSTFGGSELGCAVALKVLDISSSPSFLNHVGQIAELFSEGFKILKEKHPQVLVRLRQLGLMMGIEMTNEYCGPLFTKAAYDHGLLSVYANNDPRVAQLLPPLITDPILAGNILERVDQSLSAVENMLMQ
jgi:acetylornithine/succinyldiaminopimelate/putrescine aminotransferase